MSLISDCRTNGATHGSSFSLGDRVTHSLHGVGVVVATWGSWTDTDPADGQSLHVSGSNIYEIRFEDEVRSVNATNLTLVESGIRAHPSAEKFPGLSPADYAALKASIEKHGLFEPIVLDAVGRILDGRNRYRACIELGIVPRTIPFETIRCAAPGQYLSEERFIFDSNIQRRHLTPTQRATLVLEFLPLVRKEAEARRRIAQTKGRATQRVNRHSGNGETAAPRKWRREQTTDQILAQKAGVGLPTMKAVIAAHDHAPELLPALTNGHLSVTEAVKLIPAKRKKARSIDPVSIDKKTVLSRWRTVWTAFINHYPPDHRKEVRQIVIESFHDPRFFAA